MCSLAFVKSNENHTQNLKTLVKKFKHVITIEEHNKIGGIGSLLSNVISENSNNTKLSKIAMNDCYSSVASAIKIISDSTI